MSSGAFFDSNVLIYLLSGDIDKAQVSERLVASGGTISVQVLNEFAWVSSRKFKKPIDEIRTALHRIRALCEVVALDVESHDLGLDIAERYKFSIYDAMLVASALSSACTVLYTEDLQHGQVIEGLTVHNPFRS